jgi:hypothetical protein
LRTRIFAFFTAANAMRRSFGMVKDALNRRLRSIRQARFPVCSRRSAAAAARVQRLQRHLVSSVISTAGARCAAAKSSNATGSHPQAFQSQLARDRMIVQSIE